MIFKIKGFFRRWSYTQATIQELALLRIKNKRLTQSLNSANAYIEKQHIANIKLREINASQLNQLMAVNEKLLEMESEQKHGNRC